MGSHHGSSTTPALTGDAGPTTKYSQLRAVVADDTPHMLEFISAIVEIEGGAEVVATATNGIDAVRAAHALLPDLVVLDVSMPRMNGFEAVPHIKRRLPDTKVLLISVGDDPEVAVCALTCGADGFFTKGSFIVECRKRIRAMFAERFAQSSM